MQAVAALVFLCLWFWRGSCESRRDKASSVADDVPGSENRSAKPVNKKWYQTAEIIGVPVTKGENLTAIVHCVGSALRTEHVDCVARAYRIPAMSPNLTQHIRVEFDRHKDREDWVRRCEEARTRRSEYISRRKWKTLPPPLTADLINATFPPLPIYLIPHISSYLKKVYCLARWLSKEYHGNVYNVHIKDGRVYATKNESKKAVKLRHMHDLVRTFRLKKHDEKSLLSFVRPQYLVGDGPAGEADEGYRQIMPDTVEGVDDDNDIDGISMHSGDDWREKLKKEFFQ